MSDFGLLDILKTETAVLEYPLWFGLPVSYCTVNLI